MADIQVGLAATDGGRVDCVGNGKGSDVGPNAVES